MYRSAQHVLQSRLDARQPTVLIFYRGERSFFCKQWLRRWLSIRGLSPRLRRLDVALLLVSSQSQGKAFSVADQLARSRPDLHPNVHFLGDPDNAVVQLLRQANLPAPVVTNPHLHRAHGWLFEHGMVQPAVVALFQHAALYHWCSRPSFLNGAGKLDRPDPWHVWDAIESQLESLTKPHRLVVRPPLHSPPSPASLPPNAAAAATSSTADTPQSPVLSDLNAAPHPVHVVEAKLLPVARPAAAAASERASSPEQQQPPSASVRSLSSSTVNGACYQPDGSHHVLPIPRILEHVFSAHAAQPQLHTSSWYDRVDTELNASQRKLHQFGAEHSAASDALPCDRLQLLGRIHGSQSSLQSSASSDYRSPEPLLTTPDKLERSRFSSYMLNDEYASSETDAVSIKDMRDAHDSDEHQYSQLFARVRSLECHSTNRSFRSLLNTESQAPSSADFREPLEGSNTSLGSDVVDSVIRKVRSVRTSDSNMMNQFRDAISFPSIRIDEEAEHLEAGVFDILKELSDHLNIQEKRSSRKSLKSTALRPLNYVAESCSPEGAMRSLERKSSVETGPATSTSFRNVPRVGIRDYSTVGTNEPLPVRRDRTTKGIIPEPGAAQPSTKSVGSLASEDVPAALSIQEGESDMLRYTVSLQSDASADDRAPLVHVHSAHISDDGDDEDRVSETHIHDEYEAYDELLVAEYEVEERVEEQQSGASRAGAPRDRPLSIGALHAWADEDREELRAIKSETSPLDKALDKQHGAPGVRGAFGVLRRSVRCDDGARPRRLDSLKAMLLRRGRAVHDGDDDLHRLASGASAAGAGTGYGACGGTANAAGAARKTARLERRWWSRRRDGEKALVVTAGMGSLWRSRRRPMR